MTKKHIIVIVFAVITVIFSALWLSAIQISFGNDINELELHQLPNDIKNDIITSLGIKEFGSIQRLRFGRPDGGYNYIVVINDDIDDFLNSNPFIAEYFGNMGDKRNLLGGDIENAGYYTEWGKVCLVIAPRDYDKMDNQNEFTSRLALFTKAANKAFKNIL